MENERLKGQLIKIMAIFFEEDYRRITHAIEVLKHAEETLNDYPQADKEIVIASAILHDVGIKPSEAELGYNTGKTQEQYGPPLVKKMLSATNLAPEKIKKICEIIGNHHSTSRYNYQELEILKIADHIVNKLDNQQKTN
ncbi:MAG: phosphohydrolase [Desulfobacteraceae bacterium 4572_35.1]|nr:MAG: phosphohydrolase [Desulfobacteraceae bacterium 4572_35.1]